MDNVSDFKLADCLIRRLCKQHDVTFVDAPISFNEEVPEALCIGETRNVAHTIYKIVAEYIKRSFDITGVQFFSDESRRDEFLILLASNLRGLIYNEHTAYSAIDDPHILRLYQYPIVWILLKNIVCPLYNKELANLKIVNAGTAEIDIARFYKKEEIQSEDISDEDFIFVNIIDNRVVQNVFIFIEALKAYDLSPIEVIKTIYETDLYDKYRGLLEIAFDEKDEIIDFESTVMAALGVSSYGLMVRKMAKLKSPMVKTAQTGVAGDPQFWYFGILEKMIDSVRGPEWSVYQALEPYIQEFWGKVEEVKQKRVKAGKDPGVPFDLLLRIKSKQTVDFEIDPTHTTQALLSSNRVW